MNARKRLERLEAARLPAAASLDPPLDVALYLKRLENHRREQAREPPIPLTPEEECFEHETNNDPEFRAYMKRISQQRKERLWREET